MGFDLQNRLRPQKPSWQDPPKGMQPTSYFFGSVGSGRSPWGLNFFRRAHQGSFGWMRYKRICEERTPQASPEPTNNEKSFGWNQKILWVDSRSTPRNPLGGMDFWKPSLGMHSFGWIRFFAHSFGWNTKNLWPSNGMSMSTECINEGRPHAYKNAWQTWKNNSLDHIPFHVRDYPSLSGGSGVNSYLQVSLARAYLRSRLCVACKRHEDVQLPTQPKSGIGAHGLRFTV